MESLALSGNVVQFVELATKFVAKCYVFWRSPEEAQRETQELSDVMHHLRTILAKMEPDQHNQEYPELARMIRSCFDLSQQLLDLVKRLQGRYPKGKVDRLMKSIVHSTKHLVKKHEIADLETRIYRLREAISIHMKLQLKAQVEDLKHEIVRKRNIPDNRALESPYASLDMMRRQLRVEFQLMCDNMKGREIFKDQDLEEIGGVISSLAPTFDPFEKARRIVRSLHFEQIHNRESDIRDAHENTFEWVFQDSTSHFNEWLHREHGLYWISGKAGSGKSTMMKFLTGDSRTRQRLEMWGGNNLVIAKHHFWSAGTSLQMSQEGLLRTLLEDILISRPDLGSRICPKQWAESNILELPRWSKTELLSCLMNLGNLTIGDDFDPAQLVHVCIFIDGLDEYSGDHSELAVLTQRLASFKNIKVCVSSRPWNDFTDAFGESQYKLELHEHTERDILTFTSDTLGQNSQFQHLKSRNPEDAESLIQAISERAQGVFLWVFLVVRSLLRGLRNEDNLPTLKRRMIELPNQLEEFFGRMLDTIEPVYMKPAARTLLMISRANGPFPMLTFLFVDLEACGTGIRSEASIPLESWPDIDPNAREMLRIKRKQLVAQCRDLLHIGTNPDEPQLLGERVGPLHRTVLDYLKTEEVNSLLLEKAGPDFEPYRALLVAHVLEIRALVRKASLRHLKTYLCGWLKDIFDFAVGLELCTGQTELETLDGFEKFLETLFEEYHYSSFEEGMQSFFNIEENASSFVNLAAYRGLKLYPKVKGFDLAKLFDDAAEAEVAKGTGKDMVELNGAFDGKVTIWSRLRTYLRMF